MIQYKTSNCTVFQSELFATTSTVIETEDLVLVADPAWLPSEVETIRQYVAGIRGERPLYLLFTHSDWDHVLGYGAFPDAITIASRGTAEHPEPDSIIQQIREFDDKYYIARPYPVNYPRINIVVDQDGARLDVGRTSITFYLAQGHTPDGMFTVVEPAGVWIAGDYLSDVEFPYIYDSSRAYEETLAKVPGILDAHAVKIMIPGHGAATISMDDVFLRSKQAMDYINRTREAAATGREAESYAQIDAYSFPIGMRRYHEDNLRLLKRELGIE